MGTNEAATKAEDVAALLGRSKPQAMTESWNLGELNLEDELVVEFQRECDEDGCRIIVDRITLFIGGHAVNMPNKLYNKIYTLAHEYACDIDPYDL
jgi:hypothetical protein